MFCILTCVVTRYDGGSSHVNVHIDVIDDRIVQCIKHTYRPLVHTYCEYCTRIGVWYVHSHQHHILQPSIQYIQRMRRYGRCIPVDFRKLPPAGIRAGDLYLAAISDFLPLIG